MKKILLFFIAIIFISCGIRKVEKSTLDVKKDVDKEVATVDNKVSEAKTETNNDVTTDDIEIVPIDSTKAIEVVAPDGRVTKYKNARISNKKTVDKTKVVNDVKAVEVSQTKASEKSNEVTKASEKKTERTSSYWWLLWLLLLIPLYFLWKKYGGLIKFV